MGLTLATGEWVVHRFSRLADDPRPMQYLDAAWAEQMQQSRCVSVELRASQWRGRVRGPLGMVVTIANDLLFDLEDDSDTRRRAIWMRSLARYVLPSVQAFDAWLRDAVERMIACHPRRASENEIIEGDDFGLGRPVARELFDTTRRFDPARERKLIDGFLRAVDRRAADGGNPYLETWPSARRRRSGRSRSTDGKRPRCVVPLSLAPGYIRDAGILENGGPPASARTRKPPSDDSLRRRLQKLTIRAQATVCALLEEWLAWRLRSDVDLALLLDHVDAVLAWEIDWRYRNEAALHSLLSQLKGGAVLSDAVRLVRRATADALCDYPHPVVDPCAALVRIVRRTLLPAQRQAFDVWVDGAITRAAALEQVPRALPRRRHFEDGGAYRAALQRAMLGAPLPRQALDADGAHTAQDRHTMLAHFVTRLDWKRNPFLRSPQQMKMLGFPGTPYTL